jgi:hypothetical protein
LDSVPAEVQGLLAAATENPNPVSRLDALFLLFQSVFNVNAARRLVLDPLVSACRAADSWKGARCLRDVAIMPASEGLPEEAAQVVASMVEGVHKRQATRSISEGAHLAPRPFFW